MKSSTIRRSTLSKESMEVIENLAKQDAESQDIIGEYVRPQENIQSSNSNNDNVNKSQEIDLLWQNFKMAQFTTNLPFSQLATGFIAGVLTTIFLIVCINCNLSNSNKMKLWGIVSPELSQEQILVDETEYTEDEETAKVSIPTEEEIVQQEQSQETDATSTEPAQTQIQETPAIDTSKMKKYIVKSGDTGESIIIRNYGSYTPERAEKIIQVNNLKNLDRINIDQVLYLP